MFDNPQFDPRILSLKRIALNGGEYGPYYDQGVLSVITQIEGTGKFIPNPLRGLAFLKHNPNILTAEEKENFERALQLRGWTLDEGVAYSNGIEAAEIELYRYKS
jgi:hypothetical protein